MKIKLILFFLLSIFLIFSNGYSDDFTVTSVPQIDASERSLLFQGTLNASDSLDSVLNTIIAGTWTAGSTKDRVKKAFTKTVPTGKKVKVILQIQYKIEDE